jgi:hypothetical protein
LSIEDGGSLSSTSRRFLSEQAIPHLLLTLPLDLFALPHLLLTLSLDLFTLPLDLFTLPLDRARDCA